MARQEYWDMKDKVVDMEQLVLRVLGFEVDTFQPYRLLLNYCRSLRCRPSVVQAAWAFVTDSLYLPTCHIGGIAASAVACSGLLLAQCALGLRIGGTRYIGDAVGARDRELCMTKEVWAALGASTADVESCCADLLDLYGRGGTLGA
jgi:hypothetical protein